MIVLYEWIVYECLMCSVSIVIVWHVCCLWHVIFEGLVCLAHVVPEKVERGA